MNSWQPRADYVRGITFTTVMFILLYLCNKGFLMCMRHQRPSTQDLLCNAFVYCTAALTQHPKKRHLTLGDRATLVAIETNVFIQLGKPLDPSLLQRDENHTITAYFNRSQI